MAVKHVKLTVVSDLTCPWCYIGQRDLFAAIEEVTRTNPNISFGVEYRPFILHPSVKDDEPLDKRTWAIKRFGEEKLRALLERVTERAKECNLELNFDGKICSTLRAHRLLLRAWKLGGQNTQQKLLDGLFKASFEEALDISNLDVLATIAQEAGVMNKPEALNYLNSDEDLQEVDDMVEQARAGGVSGVPVMVIDGKWAISGGQAKDVYLQIFQKLATCSGCNGGPESVQTDSNASCHVSAPTRDNDSCVATTA
jgi:predicted DsbA family dithiol-disulfide isomerase